MSSLNQLLTNVSPLLPEAMLTETVIFVQIGVAVTIIALGQYSTARRNAVQDSQRPLPPLPQNVDQATALMQMVTQNVREANELMEYMKLLSFFTSSGALYFVAAPALLVLMALSRMSNPPDTQLASNLVLVFVILPLGANACRYLRYLARRAPADPVAPLLTIL
jgi:hypothetical protein